MSADGRYAAFLSHATNLVANDTNRIQDIFVRDLLLARTRVVSIATDGTLANHGSALPSISADGRFVAFQSEASNLVPGDTNNVNDIFVHDRDADGDGVFDEPEAGQVKTVLISVGFDGAVAKGWSMSPSLSANGRFVAFESSASNLIPGPGVGGIQVFRHDRDSDENGIFDEPGATRTELAAVRAYGSGEVESSRYPSISADGRHVAFISKAGYLVQNDTNGLDDVFVRTFAPTAGPIVFKVDNLGNVFADGKYSSPAADFAEAWAVSRAPAAASGTQPSDQAPDRSALEPGDVLALGPDGGVVRAGEQGAGPVIGVYATRPGFLAGGPASPAGRSLDASSVRVPVAMVGIVPVKVSVQHGPIQPGDLLGLASEPGRAARAQTVTLGGQRFHSPGSFFAKALEGMDRDGTIRALLTLQ
jgi:hypothetical protein